MKYKIGELYIVYEGTKERPVVIINNGLGIDIDISVARVTSQRVRNEFDVEIKHWQVAGLSKPSLVRCSKINTITPGQEMLKIGELHSEDLVSVRDAIMEYINNGFESLA